jgi:nitrate reductase delta subunit
MPVLDLSINHKEVYNMKDLHHYTVLSEMLRYPTEDLKKFAPEWRNIVGWYNPELTEYLDPFISHITDKPLEFQQEYFVSTFDVQPLCCLDIGYALFGEDYRRGQFMANLKAEHRKAGNDCGTELPDHLPVLMTLLPKLAEQSFADELAYSLVIPAIHEMTEGFRTSNNLYRGLLLIIVSIMEKDFQSLEFERFQIDKKAKKQVQPMH